MTHTDSPSAGLQPDLAREFPVLAHVNFLNHAAVSPLPRRAAEMVQRFAREALEVGAVAWPEWAARIGRARARTAQLLACGQDESLSQTRRSASCASPIRCRGGRATTSSPPPASFRPTCTRWRNLAARGWRCARRGAAHRSFAPDVFAAAFDGPHAPRRRLDSCRTAPAPMPVVALAELCRRRGILFCIDSIQAHRRDADPPDDLGADFMSADGHKWRWASRARDCSSQARAAEPARRDDDGMVRPGCGRSISPIATSAGRGGPALQEGSQNAVGIGALGESIGLILEVGPMKSGGGSRR